MKVRNILSNTAVKVTAIAACAVLLVGIGAFSSLEAKATEGKNDNINLEKATAIALEDAKFKESDVTRVKATSDKDDGTLKYEIQFIADGKEYEYDINSKTGEILNQSIEKQEAKQTKEKDNKQSAESKTVASKPVVSEPAADQITLAEAQAIALKDASASSDTKAKVELDEDDGVLYYDVEFISSNKEYDYDISAQTGKILDKSVENRESEKPAENKPAESKPVESNLTVDAAKSIALNDAKVTKATFIKAELDRDDGVSIYEIEFVADGYEYEYEINASTGSILDKSVDRDND